MNFDSASVFLHKVERREAAREKIYQLSTIVQSAHAVGFLVTDVPYGESKISRFGVEETLVDGIILLSATVVGMARERFIEVYKVRNTIHSNGNHRMVIRKGGIVIEPQSPGA